MAQYTVQLLGGFQVLVDGRPSDTWRNRRAADLVKVLALSPTKTLHRGQLMDLLWPDLSGDSAAANLRKAVHFARRALRGEDAISSTVGMLTLGAGQVDVDVDRFIGASADALEADDPARCDDAAQLYTGDLLPADRYQSWADQPREQLRRSYLAVLKGARQWDRVLQWDVTDEESHRALMRAHLAAGRRREAIRQFELLRDALRESLGVSPDPDSVALYEQILKLETPVPVSAANRAAAAVATGFLHLNRSEFLEAERLARQARELAIDVVAVDEISDATALLALVSFRTGRWQELSHQEFTDALTMTDELARITYDANLCFAEYYLAGAASAMSARRYAEDLHRQSLTARSDLGRGVARLILGEALLMSGELRQARHHLRGAYNITARAGADCASLIALEHWAQTETAMGDPARAAALLASAHIPAARSKARSHLLVRILGARIQSVVDPVIALNLVTAAERSLARLHRVCEPCSINYHIQATIACARAGDPIRAHQHLSDAERVAGLWQSGPTSAAVWEARAALRQAEGHPTQAAALLREAAYEYGQADRVVDQQRCQQAVREGHPSVDISA